MSNGSWLPIGLGAFMAGIALGRALAPSEAQAQVPAPPAPGTPGAPPPDPGPFNLDTPPNSLLQFAVRFDPERRDEAIEQIKSDKMRPVEIGPNYLIAEAWASRSRQMNLPIQRRHAIIYDVTIIDPATARSFSREQIAELIARQSEDDE